ncbi:hypothetical protein Ddye_015688 [Dipteronia dyeriana]|uniref:Uncharacterized protein n=1 Tax=Dipteronia dyeriana TaxID=168575 RepID=A0AAD9U6C3_9ROSI|nr:hypothetical protein Ddye_015688 [Dipteronia dyeriana]
MQILLEFSEEIAEMRGFSGRRERRFHFEECWVNKQEFQDLITGVWEGDDSAVSVLAVQTKIKVCTDKLKAWSKKCNEQLRADIKNNKIELCAASMEIGPGSWKVIRGIESQLDSYLDIEERYWRQRSTVEWLRSGDRNIRYFHQKASARKAQKKVRGLFGVDGVWKSQDKIWKMWCLSIFRIYSAQVVLLLKCLKQF